MVSEKTQISSHFRNSRITSLLTTGARSEAYRPLERHRVVQLWPEFKRPQLFPFGNLRRLDATHGGNSNRDFFGSPVAREIS